MTIPAFAPGCFGSALAYSECDAVCSVCPFKTKCEPAHLATKAELRERYGIKTSAEVAIEKREKRVADERKRKAERDAWIAAQEKRERFETIMSEKARNLIDRLNNGNFDIVGSLRRGENPFANSYAYLRLTAHLLLRMKRVPRETLVAAYAKKLNLKDSVAEAYAYLAVTALEHVGAIRSIDGVITIKEA